MGWPSFSTKQILLHMKKYKGGGGNWLGGVPQGKNGPALFFPGEKTDWEEIPACYTGAIYMC